MGKRRLWMRWMAVVASAMLMAGIFPPYNFTPLVWVALLPFLAAVWTVQGKRRAWKGFALGYAAGAITYLIQLTWVGVVATAGAIALPLYLAVYWGLFGAFAATLGNPWHSRMGTTGIAFSNAAIWAGLEIARGWVITGFGWNALGIGLHNQLIMAQAADLLGVAGLSGILVFIQTLAVQAAGSRKWQPAALALATVAALAGYGSYRISSEHARESTRLKALLVQLNIPMEASTMLWTTEETHMGYEDETRAGLEANRTNWPDWVVWPETALNGRILRLPDGTWGQWEGNSITISQVRESGRFHLLYGVIEAEGERLGDQIVPKKGEVYNSLAVMDPEDNLQTFRKHHLVIFGETIPFMDTFPWLKEIYKEQSGEEYGGSFTAGTSLEPLTIQHGAQAIGVIPTICYEDTVPRLVRKFIRPGPQVIVNVTNDGWFKESQESEQHYLAGLFRAIELHRPMLRCGNTGVSAAIDSTGSTRHPDTGMEQILRDSNGSPFTRGSLLAELNVPLQPLISFYARVGDSGVIFLSALGFFLAVARRKKPIMHSAR